MNYNDKMQLSLIRQDIYLKTNMSTGVQGWVNIVGCFMNY